jgi:hypothetical protein
MSISEIPLSTIRPVTLTWQLVRGTGWSSRGIGRSGMGYYSHIDTVTPGGLLRGAFSVPMVRTFPDGVRREIPAGVEDRPHYHSHWSACTRFTRTVTPAQYDAYWKFSDAQLHKPYDSRGLISTFIFGREWRDVDSWWCSELVAACGEAALLWVIPPEVTAVEPGHCAFMFAGPEYTRTEMAPMPGLL